jgi:superfamily I DNA and/or RNA helicase
MTKLMRRFKRIGRKVRFPDICFRMRWLLLRAISIKFYDGGLRPASLVFNPRPAYLARKAATARLNLVSNDGSSFKIESFSAFLNVKNGAEFRSAQGSKSNPVETDVVGVLARGLLESGLSVPHVNMHVLTGYAAQRDLLLEKSIGVKCTTGDVAQGKEADVLIVSMTRIKTAEDLGSSIGFLGVRNRINVIPSRPREFILFVGDYGVFKQHPVWGEYFGIMEQSVRMDNPSAKLSTT